FILPFIGQRSSTVSSKAGSGNSAFRLAGLSLVRIAAPFQPDPPFPQRGPKSPPVALATALIPPTSHGRRSFPVTPRPGAVACQAAQITRTQGAACNLTWSQERSTVIDCCNRMGVGVVFASTERCRVCRRMDEESANADRRAPQLADAAPSAR